MLHGAILASLILAGAEAAPGILMVVDARPEANQGDSRRLTILARLLLGLDEKGVGDAGAVEEPPGSRAPEESLMRALLEADPPRTGEPAARIAEAARELGLARAVVGRISAPAGGGPVEGKPPATVLAAVAVVDAERGVVIARTASPPPEPRSGDPPVTGAAAALAQALGEAAGRRWDPFDIAVAHLEASRRSGDPLAAEGTARALLGSRPDARLHRIIALCREARGDHGAALEHWGEALALSLARSPALSPGDPAPAALRAHRAAALARVGEPAAAAAEYRLALEGSAAPERKAIESALKALEEPARREEARLAAWKEAGEKAESLRSEAAALASRRAEEAAAEERALRARVASEPGSAGARAALGAFLLAGRRFSAAAAEFREGLKSDGTSARLRLDLCRALAGLLPPGGSPVSSSVEAEAQMLLEEAARLAPEDPEPLIFLGDLLDRRWEGLHPRWSEQGGGGPAFDLRAYQRSSLPASGPSPGDPGRAFELHRRAAEVSPDDPRAAARLADGLLSRGETARALALARSAAARGSYPDCHRVLASALLESGDSAGAEKEMARFLLRTARGPRDRARAAKEALEAGLGEEAGAAFALGLLEEPAAAELISLRGRRSFEEGRPEEALADLRLAIALNPLPAGDPGKERLVVAALSDLSERLLGLSRPFEALAELKGPLGLLAAEEARLRGSRLPPERAGVERELTPPPSRREEPVDFGNVRDRAAWARVRLLSGRARAALGERSAAISDLRWAARCVAVERGRVRPEEDWPAALSPASRALAAEAVAHLGLLALESGEREEAGRHRELARSLAAGPVPGAIAELEKALR